MENPFAQSKYGRRLEDPHTGEKYCAFEGYYVDGGIAEVVVPDMIDGLKVKGLVSRAFQHKRVKRVVLPDCIEKIRYEYADEKR